MAESWSAGRWSVGLEYTVVTVWSASLSTGRGGTSDGSITSSITCGQNFALEASMADSQRTMYFVMVLFSTGFSALHHTKI